MRALYGSRFQHILVDEYQDTNYLQSRLIDMLAREHGQLMVVGDDAQSLSLIHISKSPPVTI